MEFNSARTLQECQHQLNQSPPETLYSAVAFDAEHPLAQPYLEDGHAFIAFHADIHRMCEMQLGHLPVEAISIPYNPATTFAEDVFPVYRLAQHPPTGDEKKYSFDMKKQLSLLFPTKFIAALYELQSLFHRFQLKGYLIGGIARDMILTEDRKLLIRDVDITIEGLANEAAQAIDAHSRNFTVREIYEEFGTAKLDYKEMVMLDFASTRGERYDRCGALPTVIRRGVPLYQDIQRRDFSINTLGLAIHDIGMLYDYVYGLRDLEARNIHVLTGATFFEDPSRILRAFKFANRLEFTLSLQTRWLMKQYLAHAHLTGYRGGGSRIKESLKEWLSLPPGSLKNELLNTFLGMQGLRCVMSQIPPELKAEADGPPQPFTLSLAQRGDISHACQKLGSLWEGIQQNLNEVFQLEDPYSDPLDPDTSNERALWYIYVCYLFLPFQENAPLRDALMQRLELTRLCREILNDFHALRKAEPLRSLNLDASPAQLCEAFDPYEPLSLLAYILLQEEPAQWLEPLVRYLKRWRRLKPQLSGDDILELGVPEGTEVGRCLKGIRKAYLTGQIHSIQDEKEFVDEFRQTLDEGA